MTTTISVEDDTLERFKRVKREAANEGGHKNYSGDEFVTILLDMWEDDDIMLDTPSIGGLEPDDLQERLDRIESGVREATNAAQSADKKLEGLGR